MKTVYLDHCATTPLHPEVLKAMLPFLRDAFGNPSSAHALGRTAREAVEEARGRVADLIGARPAEIVFTSGGTEADNLAIQGIARARRDRGNHIVTSAIEHHAVTRTCEYLAGNGFTITYLPVDRHGVVNPEDVRRALTDKTILVTIMHSNNEVGTIEPISEIGKMVAERGVTFHTDAVQSVGKVPLDVKELQVDMLSIAAHKLYGPKGIGALYIKEGTKIEPILYGGEQENGIRSGTENVASIAGLGMACEVARRTVSASMKRIGKLRDALQERISASIQDLTINGHPASRLPGVLSISVPGIAAELIVRNLDARGIAVSAGSACTSHSVEISHVLSAMGLSKDIAQGTVRMSLGIKSTPDEIEYAASSFIDVAGKLKTLSDIENSLGSRRCS
ncbi:MAG TPA: cysteine desulfurase family protein [Syntrophales bacterium]|nr:cysteine desulfurase family protein [Syntrophales bacterium]